MTTVSVNEADVGVIASFAGARPVPLSPADVESAGLVATICNVPLGAALVGAKTTSTVQLPGTPSVIDEQVSAMIWNSVEPTMLACRVPVGDAPVFVTVNRTAVPFVPCASEPKSWFSGLMLSFPGAIPVPVNVAVADTPVPAVTVSVPFLTPVEVGVNRTVIDAVVAGHDRGGASVRGRSRIANCPASADVAPATDDSRHRRRDPAAVA